MIQPGTYLTVADNSGPKIIACFQILGGTRHRYAFMGDMIVASVKKADPQSQIAEGEIVHAVVVRARKERRRPDGSYVRFDDNAAVLIDKDKEPRGTRILGPIAREVQQRGFRKIASMAPEVL